MAMKRISTTLAAAIGVFLAVAAGASLAATADTLRVESGDIHGAAGEEAIAFKGIPYAAPPVGPLRWKPPQPPVPWTGVREASAFGPVCPQAPGIGVPAGAVMSEDCLTLNVWAPLKSQGPAPVMVWLHGGGDDAGAASQPQFDGAVFARDGIVFVSVDYRLGVLGWFAHPALTREAAPGAPLANYGLMDEIAALKWVQRNIAAFGGDPKAVTVAGESAGGEAVLVLMATPAAKGLFARAIVESGSGWAGHSSLDWAEKDGADLVKRAGAPPDANAAALRALPWAALQAAYQGDTVIVIDGRLLGEAPAQAFVGGRSAPVPLLIGSNSGEDSLLGSSDPAAVLKGFAPEQLTALRAAYGADAPDDGALGRAIFRDYWMGAPARWYAARQSARGPTFLYQFGYIPGVLRSRRTVAAHGFEMLFAFEALDRAPIPLPASPTDRAEMSLVHGCWVTFVTTGTPACPGPVAWPSYTPASDQLLLFGPDGSSVATGFHKAADDIFDGIEAANLEGSAP